ncbi:chemotaxis protein CheW [Ectothiorhodospira lacustris]|uniref:chemotaxis protein CheW n=1 Tax=Ectothiorhodospira lacustris TaxID=2899127 RepID=UPI001EE94BB1|nr:chemotaxis protein CheW [Ectothiorhodospira lacustris]MCG5510802.1 chemotaxis protein CheW [Ectothiorhodospira lacustris]MCG5522534.1 chemotaxis protein CheW [Ectothiorhodospira lacustris]
MTTNAMEDPFSYLLEVERKGRSLGGQFPIQDELRGAWKGVLFQLHGRSLLAPMDQVAEIVTPPPFTRVPGVKHWALGIANMRGNLLPMMDLHGFLFGGNLAGEARRHRLLVMSHQGVYAGLMVEAVMGMKHYWKQERTEELPPVDEPFRPYLAGACRRGAEHLAVFSPWKLVDDPDFMNISA